MYRGTSTTASTVSSAELRRRGGGSLKSQESSRTFSVQNADLETVMSSSSSTAPSTSGRDRTGEFAAAVRSFRGRQQTQFAAPHQQHLDMNGGPKHGELARQSAEFMTIAASIGKDIARTYTKLEKLTLLAKRRTLFDDRPQEIQELTHIIKEDMAALNRQIGQLQQIARAKQQTLRSRHQASHSSSVVVALQSRLAAMGSDFKQVLEVRTENLKESRSRREQFSQGAVTTTLPQSAVNGYHTGSVLAAAAMDDEAASRNGQVAIPMEDQQQQQQQHGGDLTYLQSRADAMQNIESTIVELGGIFQQLAHMIKEQEEVMVRIDSNVEDTMMNVEQGHSEILKYFQSVTSNRWLMVKIFGVLIFFFIFFVIFMA